LPSIVRLSTAARKKKRKNNEEMNAIKMRTLKATEQNTPLGN